MKIAFVFLLLLCFSQLATAKSEQALTLGKEVYEETCISCHGENGEGNDAIKLVVKPRQLNKTILTQDQAFEIIKHGAHHFGAHSEIMPGFKSVYSDAQLYGVAMYISTTFNKHRTQRIQKLLDAATPLSQTDEDKMLKVGKKIFKRRCSWCHGEKGDANSIYVEASKENKNLIYPYDLTKTLLDEEQIFLYAKYGGHFWGTAKDDMPSWKKKYNDVQLKSVAHFVETQIKNLKKEN